MKVDKLFEVLDTKSKGTVTAIGKFGNSEQLSIRVGKDIMNVAFNLSDFPDFKKVKVGSKVIVTIREYTVGSPNIVDIKLGHEIEPSITTKPKVDID